MLNGLVTANGKKKRSTAAVILYAVLFVYLFAMLVGFTGVTLFAVAMSISEANRWLYFAFAAIMSFAICLITGIFSTQSQIFSAKDNELLLAMPIKTSDILISRICSVIIPDLFFSVTINLTAGVIYAITVGLNFVGVISLVLSSVLIPMLSFAISALIGWVISAISARMPKKNVVSIALFLAFFMLYFYFMMNINTVMRNFMTNGDVYADEISKIFPLYFLGKASTNGDIVSLLLSILISVVPFLLVVYFINRSFIKIVSVKRGEKKKGYVSGESKSRSAFSALLFRELGRLFGSVAYLMNSIVGLFFVIIGAAIMIIESGSLSEVGKAAPGVFPILVTGGLCFVVTMVTPLASSISLEGKNLWIIRSMPISSEKILLSKLTMHLILVNPLCLIFSVVVCLIFGVGIIEGISVILLPQLFSFMIGTAQLLVNLMLPKLDYVSEIQVVKQSAAVTVSMFGGMGISLILLIPGVILGMIIPIEIYAVCCTLVVCAVDIVLYKLLTGYGVKKFERLI